MKKSLFLMALFISSLSVTTFAQDENSINNSDTNLVKVIVLPFETNMDFPYNNDFARYAVINSLVFRNCEIIEDPAQWEKLFDSEYSLFNVSREDAKNIAELMGVDMVIYGEADLNNFFTTTRASGMWNTRVIERPVKIYIYDLKSNSIVLSERLETYSNWGLIKTRSNLTHLMDEVIFKLVSWGYLK